MGLGTTLLLGLGRLQLPAPSPLPLEGLCLLLWAGAVWWYVRLFLTPEVAASWCWVVFPGLAASPRPLPWLSVGLCLGQGVSIRACRVSPAPPAGLSLGR